MSRAIRIAHIADTHLGYRALNKVDPQTGRNQRTVDFERAFEWAIDDIVNEQKPDAVIHAGDVFHHARPTWQSMRHFIQQWQKIEQAGIPSLIIAGNHDTPRVRTGGSAYSVLELALPKTKFYADYTDHHDFETFQQLGVHVHAVPHGALTNDDPVVPQTFDGFINAMVIHGMANDIMKPGVTAEVGEAQLNRGILDRQFDYIALGHFHLHMQPPGISNGWYSGSTERTSRYQHKLETEFLVDLDSRDIPGYCLVTLNGPGQGFEEPEVREIPTDIVRPMIDLPRTRGENMRGREIADEVIRKIERYPADATIMQRAIVRAPIWDAERGDKREAESILRREASSLVWHLTVPVEPSRQKQPNDKIDTDQEFPDVRELFGQFVESRTGTAFNDRFAQVFRERGDAALAEAIAAAVTIAPEEDELT